MTPDVIAAAVAIPTTTALQKLITALTARVTMLESAGSKVVALQAQVDELRRELAQKK